MVESSLAAFGGKRERSTTESGSQNKRLRLSKDHEEGTVKAPKKGCERQQLLGEPNEQSVVPAQRYHQLSAGQSGPMTM
jgi:hypothetical protein